MQPQHQRNTLKERYLAEGSQISMRVTQRPTWQAFHPIGKRHQPYYAGSLERLFGLFSSLQSDVYCIEFGQVPDNIQKNLHLNMAMGVDIAGQLTKYREVLLVNLFSCMISSLVTQNMI